MQNSQSPKFAIVIFEFEGHFGRSIRCKKTKHTNRVTLSSVHLQTLNLLNKSANQVMTAFDPFFLPDRGKKAKTLIWLWQHFFGKPYYQCLRNFAETFIVLDEMQVSWKRKIDGDLHLKSELFCRRPPVCRELPISNILWSLLTSHLLHKSNYSSTISLYSCPSILMTYKYTFIGAWLELEWNWTIFLVVVFFSIEVPTNECALS